MQFGKLHIDTMPVADGSGGYYNVIYASDPNAEPNQEIGNFTIPADEVKTYGSLQAAITAHMRRYHPRNKPVDRSTYHKICGRKTELLAEVTELISELLNQNGGRITRYPELDSDGCLGEFAATTIFPGKHSNLKIGITDIYQGPGGVLMADGIDERTGGKEEGFRIADEHLLGAFDFITEAFGFN